MQSADSRRPWTFYAYAAFFTLFVLFLYGPMTVIYILSFQGPSGGMTFPMNGFSLHWFDALFSQSKGYKKVYTEYRTSAEQQVHQDKIPPGTNDHIRRYFDLIRPRE